MGKESYEAWLDDRTYIVVDLEIALSRVVGFVVRLMLLTPVGPVDVARYDTAHGLPHRDVLDRRGRTVSKDWLPQTDFGEALTCAIRDFRENYSLYVEKWEKS